MRHDLDPADLDKLLQDALERNKDKLRNQYWPLNFKAAATELAILYHADVGSLPFGVTFGPAVVCEIGEMLDMDKPYASYAAPLSDFEGSRERAYCYAICHCVARIEQQLQEKGE